MKISGFIKCHRTADHLFTLRTFVDKYVQHTPRGKLYSCFADFKKTFDSIWHKGLLHKLYKAHTKSENVKMPFFLGKFTKLFPCNFTSIIISKITNFKFVILQSI